MNISSYIDLASNVTKYTLAIIVISCANSHCFKVLSCPL